MLLTIPAVASCVVAVLALLVGVVTIAMSSGPGWRELRWFGAAALCASIYAVCALESTLAVGPMWRAFFPRLGGASASLLVGCWFVYFASNQQRALARWERIVVGAIIVIGVAWLIPGVCRTADVFVRNVPWLGVSYTTTRPTALGMLTYVLLLGATCVLDARVFAAWRRGNRSGLADFLGVNVQLVAGVNDALAASGKTNMPYLLDVGQFAVVIAVGVTLTTRFIENARALERSSAELRAAQSELVRNERLAALGELSAVVAHEVRNPVAIIFSALATLRKERVSTEAATLLDIVNEEAERLKRVIGELLDFARPRALSVDSVVATRLVESATTAAMRGFAGDDQVDIVADDDLPELAADEQLLRQALVNLIMNALQAPGRSNRVRVRIRVDGRPATSVSFEVSDDGYGIPSNVAEKIFTPFFTTRASGTGLGLAIVKRIAEAHGGSVGWHPNEPRGVTFELRIPTTRASTSGTRLAGNT